MTQATLDLQTPNLPPPPPPELEDADGIDENDEVETGFSTHISPPTWNGIGSVLDKPPTVEEAIKAAGLDWTVSLRRLQLVDGAQLNNYFASVRDSDNSMLGVVGKNYVPLQNAEAFKWFQPFVDAGECTLDVAGSLKSGRKVWVLAKVKGGDCDIQKGDPVTQYIMLSNGHDGHMTIRCGFTVIRVVCANTLKRAHADGRMLKVRHTSNAVEALERIRDIMDLVRADFAHTTEQMQRLTRYRCDDALLARYVREVFKPGHADDETAAKKMVEAMQPLFESGRGAELSRGTMWGAFNAVTEYLTHERGKDADNRLNNLWFTGGTDMAGRALYVALEFCDGIAPTRLDVI